MTDKQIRKMYGDSLADMDPAPFLIHDWRNDVETIGYAPSEMVSLRDQWIRFYGQPLKKDATKEIERESIEDGPK